MGCQQSKAANVHHASANKTSSIPHNSTQPLSPNSHVSMIRNVVLPREVNKISNPGQKLFYLLNLALQNTKRNKVDDLIWAKICKICQKSKNAADYQDPKSGDTPLHLACRLLTIFPFDESSNVLAPLDAIKVMIRCSVDIASVPNKQGYIPLHDIVRLDTNAFKGVTSSSALMHQTQVVNFLIAADYEASVEYLQRNDVVHDMKHGAATPLYHAVASVIDDFDVAPGATVAFISAIHFPSPNMVSAQNRDNYDKPLALLYRRFSRQFDLSEQFFPGDNSRQEVVNHRNRYKTAAMNTWKVVLALLDPLLDKRKAVSDFYMVHAAVRMETPPDLLRYIIETRPEEVRQTDENGQLPLHVAAGSDKSASTSKYHYKFVIDELLYSYPDGAASVDAENLLPLQLAIYSGKAWIGGGTKSLYDVYPDAMSQVSMDENPSIKTALSFSTNFGAEEQKTDGLDAITKEEHYDAIMLVQKPNADLGDVISAMWANEEDGGVQMLGCAAIADMAKKISKDKVKLNWMALTSVTTVVNAMKNHPNEPAVQEKGCNALRILAAADNYREVSFAASGAIASIVSAMQAHVSDAIVQREACCALRQIVKYGGKERATVIASVSGFTALQNALGAHPVDVLVQTEACRTLECLTAIQSANLPDLPTTQTGPLLEAAKQRFPDECGDVADIVLSRLS